MLTKYIPRKITWNVNHSTFWITCHCSALLGAPQIISYGGRGALHFLFGGPEMGELERNISTFLLKKISADQMKAIKSFVKHLKVFFFPPLGVIYVHQYRLRGHFLFSFFPTQWTRLLVWQCQKSSYLDLAVWRQCYLHSTTQQCHSIIL